MKKHSILIFLSGCLVALTSCSDWLDISADTKITQDDMFKSYEGCRSSLNGIYRKMAEPELYGKSLNYGVVSCLANNYDPSELPYALRFIAKGDYTNSTARSVIDKIWKNGYQVIANCNNLIQHVETKDDNFFYEGAIEKQMILGEARGLRALMHFDLLRLYAPAKDDGSKYIPYVTVYPTLQPAHLTVKEVLNLIITDLTYAKNALAQVDTVYNRMGLSDPYDRVKSYSYGQRGGEFFQARGTRLNYCAAAGLLARVYQYAGDSDNAYKYALEVYRFAGADPSEEWFPFTASYNMPSDNPDGVFRKMYDDLIFSFYNKDLWKNFSDEMSSNGHYQYINTSELFGTDLDDYRYSRLIGENNGTLRWEEPTGDGLRGSVELQGSMAPVIRASEIYYIMCEHLCYTDMNQAVTLLQKLRTARGSKAQIPTSYGSPEDFLEILYNDFTREFMSEAQTFYLYKRLGRKMYNGDYPIDMTNRYVLPQPIQETSY